MSSSPSRPPRRAALKVNEPLKAASLADSIGAKAPPAATPLPAVYALKQWSVRCSDKGWHIGMTAYLGDRQVWRGPYKSLRHATTAIARLLEAEASERHAKRCAARKLAP